MLKPPLHSFFSPLLWEPTVPLGKPITGVIEVRFGSPSDSFGWTGSSFFFTFWAINTTVAICSLTGTTADIGATDRFLPLNSPLRSLVLSLKLLLLIRLLLLLLVLLITLLDTLPEVAVLLTLLLLSLALLVSLQLLPLAAEFKTLPPAGCFSLFT